MKNINITVGICGGRLSGKDTLAELIQEQTLQGEDWWGVQSLAGPIKEQYAELMQINKEVLANQGAAKEVHRMGLITLGAIRRSDNIDWWCEALHQAHEGENIIIPDIRYKNELEYYKKHSNFFFLVEIKASMESLVSRGWKKNAADETLSEMEYKEFSNEAVYAITNDGSKEELEDRAKDFYLNHLKTQEEH